MGGLLIFGAAETGEAEKFDSLLIPYMLIGAVVVMVAIAFIFTHLPEKKEMNSKGAEENPTIRMLLKHPFFILAVITQFLYVAAQTGINLFFLYYGYLVPNNLIYNIISFYVVVSINYYVLLQKVLFNS